MSRETLSRLNRLDELTGLLKSKECYTASELADLLNISTRTLMRDLDLLREKGYPIESDQGRGGGIRLHRHWGVGRLQLNYQEVIDLLLSLAIMEKIGSPIFLENLRAIRHKISISFPQEQREKVQSLRNRILIGDLASQQIMENHHPPVKKSAKTIYEAFFEMNRLNIVYTDAIGQKTNRTIEAHYLFLNWPIWYVIAWDLLRNDVRYFRLDRVNNANIEGTTFKLKNSKKFKECVEDVSSNL